MVSESSSKPSRAARITIRGIIYAIIAGVGLTLEIFVLRQSRFVILFGYSLILLIALYYIFILRKKQDPASS